MAEAARAGAHATPCHLDLTRARPYRLPLWYGHHIDCTIGDVHRSGNGTGVVLARVPDEYGQCREPWPEAGATPGCVYVFRADASQVVHACGVRRRFPEQRVTTEVCNNIQRRTLLVRRTPSELDIEKIQRHVCLRTADRSPPGTPANYTVITHRRWPRTVSSTAGSRKSRSANAPSVVTPRTQAVLLAEGDPVRLQQVSHLVPALDTEHLTRRHQQPATMSRDYQHRHNQ